MGHLALDLGNLYRATGAELANASLLFQFLHKADLAAWLARLPAGALEKTAQRLEEIVAPLTLARLRCADAELVRDEFALVAQMLRHGLHRAGAGQESAQDLHALLAGHCRLWLARNRPGGLADSQRPLRARLP